ncbi:hypothetical protein A203_01300 [Chromobacterium violaceum]|uniref:DUF3226 domain-containing protein n=1 Tax=Chromobacterium violaceum TaxID=536 RepID=UPI003CEC6206
MMAGKIAPEPIIFIKEKVIIIEGAGELALFEGMCSRLNIDSQIIKMNGVYNIRNLLALVKNSDTFEIIKSLAVVRDADGNKNSAFDSIKDALTAKGFPSPASNGLYASDGKIRVGVMIIPPDESCGMLEDLLLKTIENDATRIRADDFLLGAVIERELNEKEPPPSNISKARLQCYLSVMREHTNSVFLAIKKNYIDLDHVELESVREFLRML